MTKPDIPVRPALALRVGVTGGRVIRPEHADRVRAQVAEVLRLIQQETACIARMSEAKCTYQTDATKEVVQSFCFLSPLAEGADRLAAKAALELGYALHVPMPFACNEYAKDFGQHSLADPPPQAGEGTDGESSAAAFGRLLKHASIVLELDGARDDPAHDRYYEVSSYQAVGRYVVRNCDLLIAIWDGTPGKGRGGTADTVEFAAEFGPPVWWIHAERNQAPTWIADTRDLHHANPDPDASRILRSYLEHLILPPKPSPPANGRPLLERIARFCLPPVQPLAAWFAPQILQRPCWTHAHRLLMKMAAGCYEPPWEEAHRPEADPVAQTWHDAYLLPDKRAGNYAAHYRSVYVLVFAMAALALTCASVALAEPGLAPHWQLFANDGWRAVKAGATMLEMTALGVILCLVVINIRRDWHQRWIDYRLLAELCRKQQALAVLGWSLSGRAVRVLVDQDGAGEDRSAWVVWLFAAMLRAAPVPHGVFDHTALEAARRIVLRDLVDEQIDYHKGRLTQCKRAGRFLVKWGERLFLAVIVIVALKLWLIWSSGTDPQIELFGLAATIVPAFAAALVGIRAYAELELLAEQSHGMHAAMQAGRDRIETMDLTRPMASQELGAEVYEVATLMLQDVQGWVRLFRVKLVEAG